MSALDRVPVSTAARERVLGILGDVLPDDEAAALARALGDEVRAALTEEHEDDLERARVRSFDFGARTVLRSLVQAGRIPEADEEAIAGRFAAGPTIEWARLHDELVPILGPGNDDAAAISQATAVVEIVRGLVP